jgi:hypothetical protein
MELAKCGTSITCQPLLPVLEQVGKKRPLRTFLFDLPEQIQQAAFPASNYKTISQLVREGKELDKLQPVVLQPGEGRERVAYLCPTSGTSGKQVRTRLRLLCSED